MGRSRTSLIIGCKELGFRFRRSIRVLPGIRLNLGRRGVSVSAGVRGAHVTMSKDGTRTTVGLPGTGMSYTDYQRHPHIVEGDTPVTTEPAAAGVSWVWVILLIAVVVVWASS